MTQAAAQPEQRCGYEAYGPPVPGCGRVLHIGDYAVGLVVRREGKSSPFIDTYLLRHGADSWERLWWH